MSSKFKFKIQNWLWFFKLLTILTYNICRLLQIWIYFLFHQNQISPCETKLTSKLKNRRRFKEYCDDGNVGVVCVVVLRHLGEDRSVLQSRRHVSSTTRFQLINVSRKTRILGWIDILIIRLGFILSFKYLNFHLKC